MVRAAAGFMSLGLLALPAAGHAAPSPAAQAVVASARADCAGLGGTLTLKRGAIRRVDLNADGRADELVDTGRMACSTAASAFCGTGGCSLTAIVAGRPTEFLARGWKALRWSGQPVLLLAVHGTMCGATGAVRCVEAVVFEPDGTARQVATP